LDVARKSYSDITNAVAACDIQSILVEFSLVIDGCGYDTNAELEKVKDFRREFLYRDIIAIFLYGTYKVEVSREVFGASGRSDLLIKYAGKTFVIEVKVAYKKKDIENKLREGVSQAHSKRYANWNFFTTRTVEILVIVIDNSTRKIVKHKHLTVMKEDVLTSDNNPECGIAHPVHDEHRHSALETESRNKG
jgi:hypothetical protein